MGQVPNGMAPAEAEKELADILRRYPATDKKKLGEEIKNIFNLTCDEFFSDQIGRKVGRDLTESEKRRIDRLYKSSSCVTIIVKFAAEGDIRCQRLLEDREPF